MENSINYISEKIKFDLKNKTGITRWINLVAKLEKKKVGAICYVFCSDKYLLNINKQYLQHDTYTDIITFDYSYNDIISGDIFISINRVKDNAKQLGIKFEIELQRVMIHGILHLLGHNDKTAKQQKAMRYAEDLYLKKLNKKT